MKGFVKYWTVDAWPSSIHIHLRTSIYSLFHVDRTDQQSRIHKQPAVLSLAASDRSVFLLRPAAPAHNSGAGAVQERKTHRLFNMSNIRLSPHALSEIRIISARVSFPPGCAETEGTVSRDSAWRMPFHPQAASLPFCRPEESQFYRRIWTPSKLQTASSLRSGGLPLHHHLSLYQPPSAFALSPAVPASRESIEQAGYRRPELSI